MKNHQVTFKNNQFIMQSGKVLHLRPKATFFINGDDIDFLEKDFLDHDLLIRDSKQKLSTLQNEYKKDYFENIGSAGTVYAFQFGLGRHTVEEQGSDNSFIFKARILEDLYIRSKNKTAWRLCDCICIVFEKVRGDLDFQFEKVEARSLSELFANLISEYFNRKRSTACNAFTTFHQLNTSESITYDTFNTQRTLDTARNKIIKKYKGDSI